MPIHNTDIADIFDQIAALLEIKGDNPFRIRAYRNAARTVRGLGRELSDLLEKGEDLSELPDIGDVLAAKIAEIIESGTASVLTRLQKQIPSTVSDLLKISGLGPKRVALLYHELDIQTPEQLCRACQDHRVQKLPGFGGKTEQRILQAVKSGITTTQRFKLAWAALYADALEKYLKRAAGVQEVVIAGSFRRAKETVGDLDILVTASAKQAVMDHFTAYDEVEQVLSKGDTRSSVILRSGLQVDLRVVAQSCFGAALHYFTGSKSHNIAIRKIGQKRGLKINEYGVFKSSKKIAGDSEESVFAAVGLPYIEPELRENQGEIEAAHQGLLPQLVKLADIRGDLHAHSTATDGHNTIRAMVLAAKDTGLEYLAITEHSKRLTVAHGLDSRRLIEQMDEIDALNKTLKAITLLKGIEVDILEDGSLDLPDEVLGRLDLVIGAIHSRFHLPRAKQTRRVLRAMEHPHFTLLAHPTGRLIEHREAYDIDMPRVIRKARERGCFIELNAHPERLGLLDSYCRLAREHGVLVSINSDSHSVMDFANLHYGVGQARRGWLEKKDVLNTRSLAQLRPLLKKTMN